MPNSYARRARTVRLRATSDTLVRRGAIILEDALRTASGPNDGRMLIVRSLPVGIIRSDQSPASAALNVERQLRQIDAMAIHAEHPAAGHQPAVYFRDDAEPYVRLAVRLARGENTDGWFWPLAVPGWQPGQDRAEALRHVFFGVFQTQAGVAAAARLVQELHEHEAIEMLLAALRWQDGLALLRVFGWSKPSVPIALTTPGKPGRKTKVGPRWESVLVRWINRWGVDDERSIWLAGVVLAAEKPSRLFDPHLSQRAQQLLKLTIEAPDLSKPNLAASQEAKERPSSSPTPQRFAIESQTKTRPALEPTPLQTPPAQPSYALDQKSVNTPAPDVAADEIPTTTAISKRTAQPAHKGEKPAVQESAMPTGADEQGVPNKVSARPWLESPQVTHYGGLFFLVPVLSRLGIAAFLKAHPHLIEHELPFRLLQYACQRLGVPADDPVMAILENKNDEPNAPCDFVAPVIWRQEVCTGPWILRRVAGETSLRILLDSSGQLPVGSWHGKAPVKARAFISDQQLQRGPLTAAEPPLQLILRAWFTAAQRWCRRYAQIELRGLVCRPCRIAATRTHLDVIFDHRQADVRIRKAGLDLNPGWVAWLGRVIYFHYLTGEETDVFDISEE